MNTTQNEQTKSSQRISALYDEESDYYYFSRRIKGTHYGIIRQTNGISIERISKICEIKPDVIEYLEDLEQVVPMEMVDALYKALKLELGDDFDLNFNDLDDFKSLLISSLTGKLYKDYEKFSPLEDMRYFALKKGFSVSK